MDFNFKTFISAPKKRFLIFWDISDLKATKLFTTKLLSSLCHHKILLAIHDIGQLTGRPKRYHWRQYESIFPDIECFGTFIDQHGWSTAHPDTEKIFGKYKNAGHWLLIEN
jgi:hypothetical protein